MLPELSEIRRKRKAVGWNQNELAEAAKCSKSMIAKIEKGRNEAGYGLVKRIFEALEAKAAESGEAEKTVEEKMASPPISFRQTDGLDTISKKMKEKDISQVPIIENGRCVGSITSKTFSDLAAEGRDPMRMKAGEAMGAEFPQVQSGTKLKSVAGLLKDAQAVLVTKDGNIVGIITKDDFI